MQEISCSQIRRGNVRCIKDVTAQFLTPNLCSHRDTPVFCALINGEGEVVDFLRLPYFMKRRNAFREDEREKKV